MALSQSAISKDPTARDDTTVYFHERLVDNDTKVRAFQFGLLKATEDRNIASGRNLDSLGTIRVQVNSVVQFKQRQRPSARPPPAIDIVHEQKKKNLVHSVHFGQAQPIEGGPTSAYDAVGVAEECSFVFNYRHMALLIAEGIVPPPKSLKSESEERMPGSRFVPDAVEGDGDTTDEEEGDEYEKDELDEEFDELSSSGARDPTDEFGGLEYVTPEPQAGPVVATTALEVRSVAESVGTLNINESRAQSIKSELAPDIIVISDDEVDVATQEQAEKPKLPILEARKAFLQKQVKLQAEIAEAEKDRSAALEARIAALKRQAELEEQLAETQGLIASSSQAGKRHPDGKGAPCDRKRKRVKTEVVDD